MSFILGLVSAVFVGCGVYIGLDSLVGVAHARHTTLESAIIACYLIGYFGAFVYLKRNS